ncbi:unnamed protein product [Brassicogethes aeneus]|uniref:protein-histidine N-methyltransferase n=1 Tax=Brassicogethes aeneus TaxID=1431903 RepID=A0A9P0B6C7_BRAAE|nr:unnamed protein product [Brassicogethes aeneus]
MFKFGFNDSESKEKDENKSQHKEVQWKESKEVVVSELNPIDSIISSCKINSLNVDNIEIDYVASTDVMDYLKLQNKECSVLNAEQNHSDLITAEYEGGLKIWECTYDLINYINSLNISFKNKRVLDLGCGSGMVGILTYLLNSKCYFQDYNNEVISNITIPNVIINSRKHNKPIENAKFFDGDWQSFLELMQKECSKFDYILTSETIYNTENYTKLINVFRHSLKKDGEVFLAAKSYYFGVGGGLSSFQEALDKNNFKYDSCWKCDTGVKREILKITLK